MASKLSLFLTELKRRKVYHVGAVYVIVGLGILGAAEVILDPLGLGALRSYLVIIVLLGFPIALVLAWAYEVRPEEAALTPQPAQPAPAVTEGYRKSIVVLPFDSMSPDPGDAYFADGLTEEIIANLSNLESLRVISRSSAIALKESRIAVRAIREELDVGYVLEGSVRKSGDNLRITAQLIDAETDAHLWAEKYEGVLEDVFGMQERVSQAIVEVLNLTFSRTRPGVPPERPIENPQAYECYLRARHDIQLCSRESCARAVRELENGIAHFGDNARLLATLGEAYFSMIDVGIETDTSLLDRARELAGRALSLDPQSPQGKLLLANLERRGGNLTTCARLIMEAHEADPNDPGILVLAAAFANWYVGQASVSRTLFDELLVIDPLTPINYLMSGLCLLDSREAKPLGLKHIRKSWAMGLELPWTRLWIGYALAANERWDEGIRELEEALEDGLPDPTAPMTRFFLGVLRGEREQALAALDPETRKYAWNDPDFPFLCSGMFSLMGETEEALKWVRHAIARGCINYPHFASDNPFLENVRSDPRFQAMVAELKPRWEAFEF